MRKNNIEIENNKAIIYTPGGNFEVKIIDSGEIEVSTPYGSVEIAPRYDNVVRIHCVPTWDDETAKRISAEIINSMGTEDSPKVAAEMIVNLLRGRVNPAFQRHQQDA